MLEPCVGFFEVRAEVHDALSETELREQALARGTRLRARSKQLRGAAGLE